MALCSLSLCSGIAGLDIGIDIAFGGPGAVLPVCYVEREITAAQIVAQRIEDGCLPPAPIWSDIATFDGCRLRGVVDIVTAGFPCPDYSLAGRRAGKFGKHGQVWDHVARIIREVGPRFVVLENVYGILVPHRRKSDRRVLPGGLWFVLGDLAESGYDAEWLCLAASDVGAPHRRTRWFCIAWKEELAYPDGRRCRQCHPQQRPDDELDSRCHEEAGIGQTEQRRHRPTSSRRGFANSIYGEIQNSRGGGSGGRAGLGPSGAAVPDSCEHGPSDAFPPAPNDEARWGRIISEWPYLAPTLEPGLRVMVDGAALVVDTNRPAQLRALGNAVVPLQAAIAVRRLLMRIYGSKREVPNVR